MNCRDYVTEHLSYVPRREPQLVVSDDGAASKSDAGAAHSLDVRSHRGAVQNASMLLGYPSPSTDGRTNTCWREQTRVCLHYMSDAA